MDVRRRNIMKDHNSESIDSTLKVNYVVDFGKNYDQRNVRLNPVLFKNSKINTPNKKFKINELRKEHYNSYSNENMDFFRLDYLCEVDRNNYHNYFMDRLKPINRKENFQKFNEIGKNIKYLDYLKENRLLNQNRKLIKNIYSDKEIETSKLRKKYYKINKDEDKNIFPDINNNINNNNENDRYLNNNLNDEENDYDKNIFKNRVNNQYLNRQKNYINRSMPILNRNELKNNKGFSKSYISNINDYSIKEGDKNIFPERNKIKLRPIVSKNYTNNEQVNSLYNSHKIINENESPFYVAYNEINKNGGFYKRKEDISRFDKIIQSPVYLRNNKSVLDKNDYRDMKNFNSVNFHKNKFNTVDI